MSFRVVLICIALQAVFTLPIYGDEIVGWGWDYYGQASPPAGNDFVAVAAGAEHSLALKSDGSIVCWGWNNHGQVTPQSGNDFIAVSAGGYHSLALKADGSIVCWGEDNEGQVSDTPTGSNFVGIAAGYYYNLALTSNGSIVGWGKNDHGQATPPTDNNFDFIAVAAGRHHSLALKSDGSIVAWGYNSNGQATPPTGNNFTAIAAARFRSLALESDGSIVGWGGQPSNYYGELSYPLETNFTAVAASYLYSLALKANGSIVAWGYDEYGQATPPQGNNFTAIAAGNHHGLALVSTNSPPVAHAGGPYLVPIDQSIMLDGSGSVDPDEDMLTDSWVLDGTALGEITGSTFTSFDQAGVTYVTLTVDDGEETDLDTAMLVVYNPEGGFVTGGGGIDSPLHDIYIYMGTEGKANFGFVSKYKKGATTPTGNTQFVFQAGDLNFQSSSYDWLVVTGSDYARFKGTGTINGDGDYKFMLWAGDGEPDTFRIKIWEELLGVEIVYYDNGVDQPISGGSIIVHAGR